MITLSEDNRQFAEAVHGDSTNHCYNHLATFSKGDGWKAVLACGVLHNIFMVMDWNDQTPGRDGACDAILVPTLSGALESNPLSNGSNGHSSPSPADVLQTTLEILASIGTTLQNSLGKKNRTKKASETEVDVDDNVMDGADEDVDDISEDDKPEEDDEMDEDEMEADMGMVTGADDADEDSDIDDLPTLKELVRGAIPQTVKLFQSLHGDDELSSLIRVHALTALSNIAWTVSCIDFSEGANTAILQAWTPVAHLLWKGVVAPVLASNTSDVELATVVTSLAWAVARTSHELPLVGGDEHKKFISLYHASKSLEANPTDPFQSLGVKCIGVLGQLALDPAPVALNRDIGVFLVMVVAGLPETPAVEAVEALNQIFDIYGDEKSINDKEVFWKDNFLQYIEATAPRVKAMVRTVDRRKSAELRLRAEEANINLKRFIRYKQKLAIR